MAAKKSDKRPPDPRCECGHRKSEHRPRGGCRHVLGAPGMSEEICDCRAFAPRPQNLKKAGERITRAAVRRSEDLPPPAIPDVSELLGPEPDEDGHDDHGLTPKQLLFCVAYVGPAGMNGTKAARMAGYSDSNNNVLASTARENLTKPQIQNHIARLLARKLATPEWAEERVRGIAMSNMANFIAVSGDGQAYLDIGKAVAAGALGQIKELTTETIQVGDSPVSVLKSKLKIHDPLPALTLLLKMAGRLQDAGDSSDKPMVVKILRGVSMDMLPPARDAGPGEGEQR